VSRQTGKGSHHQRRASAIERKATQHHDFVGDTDAERAEAEFRKRDRQQQEENREVVREMASELEAEAGVTRPDGATGWKIPIRMPRSIDEAKEIARELPDRLREKARERLGKLPEPAQTALRAAESAAILLLVPVRIGLWLAREAVMLPLSLLRDVRHREA
jgi:hypothetical protein